MDVLVSDTSVLIDLERGGVLETCFALPFRFAVPDVLYDRELKNYGGPQLIQHGLEVVESSEAVSALATQYARTTKSLSAPDAFAIALAKSHDWLLLAGDGELRKVAATDGVDCHGVLWVFDQLHTTESASPLVLWEALTTVCEHPRCRLPRAEIRRRLTVYRSGDG